MKPNISICLLLLLCTQIFGQTISPPLVTDRPDQTESSCTVPKNSLQIETGITFEKDSYTLQSHEHELQLLQIATTLFRYGLLNNLELRFGGEYDSEKFKMNGAEINTSGITGVSAGAKVQILHRKNACPDASLIFSFDLPVGNEDLRPNKVEPSVLFAGAHSVSETLDWSYNLGVAWIDGKHSQLIYSTALGIGVADNVGTFIEIYGFKPTDHDALFLCDAGVTLLAKPNFQLDASFGLALSEDAPDMFVSTGFSYRLPR